ncbi:hypothetical protein D3C84_843030 [compost metagenome]
MGFAFGVEAALVGDLVVAEIGLQRGVVLADLGLDDFVARGGRAVSRRGLALSSSGVVGTL